MWIRARRRLTAFRSIRSVSVPATEYMHCMLFSWFHMPAFPRLSNIFLFAAFKRYNINKHHRRSVSGLKFPPSGKLPVSPSRIHDKHKHLYPRRFIRAFLLCFFRVRKINKKRAASAGGYALETWDHGLTAFPNIISTTVPSPSSFSCTEVLACCFSCCAMPSIVAGCAEYYSAVSDSLGVA